MNLAIPQETIEFLKKSKIASETASNVLKKIVKNERPDSEIEAEIYIVLQVILASNYSHGKINEVLLGIGFPEDFVSGFLAGLSELPKVRAGVVLPMLVDVNWKTAHEISTSNIRKIHSQYVEVEAIIRENNGEFTSLPFNCTKAQLSELVYKLKSALQQIEKQYKN